VRACDQLVDALAEGRALDAALQAHAAACDDCRAMMAADRALAALAGSEPSREEALPPALREALRRDARPVAAFSPWRRALPAATLAVAIAALALAVMPRADLAHQPASRLALGLGAVLSGLAIALTLLLHGGRSGLGLPARARWTFVALALAGFEAINAAVTVPVEGSVHLEGAAAGQARLGCALHGGLLAALVGVAVFHGARRSAVVSPIAAGAAAGLAAGFAGALAQHLQCPVMDLDHTLVAHIAPMLLGVLLGALAGRRWLAP
jgi:hypothetical protein